MHTIWILGDQLSLRHPGLAESTPAEAVVLMIESKPRGSLLKYHQQKLVLIYSAMRHFARDLRAQGWTVDYCLLRKGSLSRPGCGGIWSGIDPRNSSWLSRTLLPKRMRCKSSRAS